MGIRLPSIARNVKQIIKKSIVPHDSSSECPKRPFNSLRRGERKKAVCCSSILLKPPAFQLLLSRAE
ncbi:hypothetical protein GIB67_032778 [Kingdonia uniflora]|uniref:Uncharacterized protein n=1 Tax=Kingdonia uniflora TaxID=39325 RepID=A0A7J7MW53_9MAGN|nr:hypothetical protein GIB67_032778 [Kingdonia uniflora]